MSMYPLSNSSSSLSHVTDEPTISHHCEIQNNNVEAREMGIEDEDRLEMCCGKMLMVRSSRPNPIIYWISVVIQQTPPKPV